MRTPTRCTKKGPNQLRAILIFLIFPTKTWLVVGYPNTTETQKVARILNKNSSSNRIHSIHTGSMNDSHSTNLFKNSCHHISTDGKAPPHFHINLQHPTILPFAVTKDFLNLVVIQPSSTHLIRSNFYSQKEYTIPFQFK